MTELPKQYYLYDTEECGWDGSPDMADCVEIGKKRFIGVYRLVQVREVIGEPRVLSTYRDSSPAESKARPIDEH